MMKMELVMEQGTDGREEIKQAFLTTSFSFEELIAMEERGEFFKSRKSSGPMGDLPFSFCDREEIRRSGEKVWEASFEKSFRRYLEDQTGRTLEKSEEDKQYETLQNCVELFKQVQDQLDAKEFEVVFRVETKHWETDPFGDVENGALYKDLRRRILVDGEKHIRICGNVRNRNDVRKTVLHLANELGNLAYAADQACGREIIAFHDGYNYENFMERVEYTRGTEETLKGLRDTAYRERVDGVFKEFCNVADQYTVPMPHVFVIENYDGERARMLFGEAFYCMAPEHRGDGIRIRTLYQSYPWASDAEHNKIRSDRFGEGFYIPENVVIIAISNEKSGNPDPVISPIYRD